MMKSLRHLFTGLAMTGAISTSTMAQADEVRYHPVVQAVSADGDMAAVSVGKSTSDMSGCRLMAMQEASRLKRDLGEGSSTQITCSDNGLMGYFKKAKLKGRASKDIKVIEQPSQNGFMATVAQFLIGKPA